MCGGSSFILKAVGWSMCAYDTVDGHLSSLQSWIKINNVARNILVHVIWKIHT